MFIAVYSFKLEKNRCWTKFLNRRLSFCVTYIVRSNPLILCVFNLVEHCPVHDVDHDENQVR